VDEAHRSAPGLDERWIRVCRLSHLIERTMVCMAGVDIILIWSDHRVVACERACPHEQADLGLGDLSAGRLVCPRHAASFDLDQGQISRGWTSRPLRIYPVRIVDGEVWVDAEAIGLSS
jgi:3-phenylpropionate/trans-cinnamate dioxygenase ferredoxin subunit